MSKRISGGERRGCGTLKQIAIIRSSLKDRHNAPRQGSEGAPDAWLEVDPEYARGLDGIGVGTRLIVITWFHRAKREVLRVRPRHDKRRAIVGVFKSRSPDRPNPLGLHPITVRAVEGSRLLVGPIEAIDGTPVVDIKVALLGWDT